MDFREELAADGSPSGIEAEEDIAIEEPFDPASISIEPKVIPMDTLIRRFRQGTIRLAPGFQRKDVWDETRRSRLIESLMLRIPLPMFYVASTEEGIWDVVDGLQRLTAIKDFILGPKQDGEGFKLVNLEFWGDRLGNKTFKEICSDSSQARIVNYIMESEMRFTVINPGTPEAVKRNIFKRINTGGMPLTMQEIRHALYQGHATRLLSQLVSSAFFLEAINGKLDDSRMAARETILRFLAFSIRPAKYYTKDMDSFLSDTMQIINCMPDLDEEKLKKILKVKNLPRLKCKNMEELVAQFNRGMRRGKIIFGDHAFRKSTPGTARAPINKTLFESWGNVLAGLDKDEFIHLRNNRQKLISHFKTKLSNPTFERSIGRGSTTQSGVRVRYKELSDIIETILRDSK
ncbi:DUF262 domain-containing protein [Desulfocurvibacter africanus]|uniref:DUF262 domain-containing protein n=1 Tax=Desulfocurvibacter africanus TaxID=873 RepID=UPI002FDA54E9